MTSQVDPAAAGRPDDVAFRAALGRFGSGVTVVTTVSGGVDHAMTASAFCSVSMDPPLVLICVDHRNRIHAALEESRTWAISLLTQSARDAATWLADRGRALEGQLDAVPHTRGPFSGAAILDDALAWLECRTWAAYPGGDHTILVGEVAFARVREDRDDPLMYYRSHYGSVVRSAVSEKNSGSISTPSADTA